MGEVRDSGWFPTKEHSCYSDSDSSFFAMSQSFAAIPTVTMLVNHQNDDCVCGPLGDSSSAALYQVISSRAEGGVFSAYTNTANTILGAGTLAVPIAMSSAGLVSYLVMTALVILVHSITVTGLMVRRRCGACNVRNSLEQGCLWVLDQQKVPIFKR